MPYTIGVVLFPDSEELDWAGPWEVLTAGAQEGDTVVTVAESMAPVRCAKGRRVLPDRSFDDCPQLDVLVVPGGLGSRSSDSLPTSTWTPRPAGSSTARS